MNLLEDLHGILIGELEGFKYTIKTDDLRKLLTGLINLQDKTVSIKRRTVHISKELSAKKLKKPYDIYLKQIINKFKNAEDVNPYLSKWSLEAKKKDLLLYDWGIHHLHLHNEFDDKGFIERSDWLLFFILEEDDVYLIDVTKHRLEDGTEFSQQNLLKILRSNWPYILEPFKMKDVIGLSEAIDDKRHSLSRRAGLFVPVEIEGEVFMPIGGGISTAKTSLTHTRKVDHVFDVLQDIERDLKFKVRNMKEITREFNILFNVVDFKLTLESNNFFVVETKSNTKVYIVNDLYDYIFGHLFEL